MSNQMQEYKIIVDGPQRSGKDSFSSHLRGIFNKDRPYFNTHGLMVIPYRVNTNMGQLQFNLWSLSGRDQTRGLEGGYFLKSDGIVFIGDTTNGSQTTRSIERTKRCMQNSNLHCPIVYAWNKCDLKTKPFTMDEEVEMSILLNVNVNEVMLRLARKITNNPNLEFV